ncbi:MAG: DNA polymerase III subunit delta [Rhodothalassiaceae bacterium]|nr:MAG: DNA polymerase III subunit delta [Rhodothalassiaceae bacterium]
MAKLTGSALARALESWPARLRAALVFGPDEGLVRERAERIARQIVPDLKDGFRIARLDDERLKADPAALVDELNAISMFGGRRLVWLRTSGDAHAGPVADALAGAASDGFLLVEAGNLAPRARLRRLFEDAADLAAIACYADGERDLAALVDGWLKDRKITADPDARAHLLASLGADRAVTRHELDKIALYFLDATDRRLDLATAEALVGDSGAAGAQEVVRAALAGDAAGLETALASALAAGVQPIALLRILAQQLLQLWPLALACARGAAPAAVVAGARPPVFFRDRPAVEAALARLRAPAWGALLDAVVAAEAAVKSGRPAEPLLRKLLLDLACGRIGGAAAAEHRAC